MVSRRRNLPPKVTGDSQLVGLRIPNHKIARELIQECGGAIIGTSANISGHPSLRTGDEVFRELEGRIDLVIDGGPAPLGRESTVVRISGDQVTIIREAAISQHDILKALSVTPAC